jgi:hypothetical protein
MLFVMSATPHQFSPSWIGVVAAAAIRACPAKSSARVGSSIQRRVRANRPRLPAQQHHERDPAGDRVGVPQRHVDAGRRHPGEALGPGQPEHAPHPLERHQRRGRAPDQRLPHRTDQAGQGAERQRGVTADVGPADDAVPGADVDQDQRGGHHDAGRRLHRPLQPQIDRARGNRLDRHSAQTNAR